MVQVKWHDCKLKKMSVSKYNRITSASHSGLLTPAFVACGTNAVELQATNAGVRRPRYRYEASITSWSTIKCAVTILVSFPGNYWSLSQAITGLIPRQLLVSFPGHHLTTVWKAGSVNDVEGKERVKRRLRVAALRLEFRILTASRMKVHNIPHVSCTMWSRLTRYMCVRVDYCWNNTAIFTLWSSYYQHIDRLYIG